MKWLLSRKESISGLTVQAPDTSEKSSVRSSTYAVYVRNSAGLVLEDVIVLGGDAADQDSGSSGASASSVRAVNGSDSGAGGGTGTFAGGSGGIGGTMDTDCTDLFGVLMCAGGTGPATGTADDGASGVDGEVIPVYAE